MGGFKLLHGRRRPTASSRPSSSSAWIVRIGDEHAVQPGVVSVTQSTELGTLYTPEELRALADHAHAHGMRLHVDGARLANAAAALDVPLRAITTDVGADVVSFGGTKAGLMLGEAVVLLGGGLEGALPYLRKQSMQLASKMRYVAAQFEALLTDELWRRAARARERDGGAAGGRRRGRRRRADHAGGAGQRRLRRAPARRRRAPAGRSGASTPGTSTPARCAGCARTTRARRTSTRSPPRWRPRWDEPRLGLDRLDGRGRGGARSTGSRSAARACASRTGTTTTS